MKQLIIARKDLNMSPGKLAVQVSHASMAFLTNAIKESAIHRQPTHYQSTGADGQPKFYMRSDLYEWAKEAWKRGEEYFYAEFGPGRSLRLAPPTSYYESVLFFDQELYEKWINDSFTKIVCEAKNKSQIEKGIKIAESLDLREGRDFFLIRDDCLTELTPEDEDGRTLTCVGFRPLPVDIVEKISKKFQLYK